MRKHLLIGMAAIASWFATSCSEELEQVNSGKTSTVSFKVETPEIKSRAYSDGKEATVLQYAVYDAEGKELTNLTKSLKKDNEESIDIKKTVNLQLTTGNTYSVIFWAAAPNAPYTVDFAGKTMTVNYNNAVSNDETRDAFYAYVKPFTVNGAETKTIELKRPFAQLNIGTADYAASTSAGYTPTMSSVIVKKLKNTLNFASGKISGDETEVTFGTADINTDETFPVKHTEEGKKYEYLAMNYLLVDAEQETVDIEFTYTDGSNAKTRKVGSVPVARNHRTNIYGNLLTSQVDINVEIKPEYDGKNNLTNVVVDGVSYDDFATAVSMALKLDKPVEFIQNVSIDADNTITIPADCRLTLNLNGYTLTGVTDDADKNDDGTLNSLDNEIMFDVRGTMNVNKGIITLKHTATNFAWDGCTDIIYVAGNGTLNVNNATLINYGGSDMAYAIDMVNAATDGNGITVNVVNSTIKSSYTPVRVFNNGSGMNNVTIQESILEGTRRAFWVHVYSDKDNGGKGVKDATLNINIFNPEHQNTFIANDSNPLIEYGFTDEIYLNEFGLIKITDENGNEIKGICQDLDGNYAVTAAEGLNWVALAVNGGNKFTGVTIKLAADIDLEGANFCTIGYNPATNTVTDFEGTFDGNNKTIKNLKRTDLIYANKRAIGLFSRVNNAVVKNLTLEDFVAATYGGEAAAVACVATGNCVFENITLKDGSVVSYNNDTAGIVGWANVGNFTFKDITIGSGVTIYSLWDSYDTTLGGIVGTLESPSTISIENATVSCAINAFNDVTANYQWYAYRRTGMVIGNMSETKTVDGRTTPDPKTAGVTCKNVTVNYGDWMNYHYCEFEANGKPSYADEGEWKFSRVEGSEWGREADIDTDNCQHDTDESHNILLPVDQLFGGGQGVYGLREYEGVTVNYPASYRREVSSAAALTEALGKGVSVILDADIDFGTTQLAITGENQVVDLGGHKLTTNMTYGGIALKNGASIVNGTIEHTSSVAAIKAFNVGSIENVTIKTTCPTTDKTITAIAVQQNGYVGSIKNVTIEGVSQGIEVGYQATVDLIEKVTVKEKTNGTANGIGLLINGGKVGKAKDCTFYGDTYGVKMHLKGKFAVGLELENCIVEGATTIYAYDEKGISNTSGSLSLTYDANTKLNGAAPFYDFEDECKSVVTINGATHQ